MAGTDAGAFVPTTYIWNIEEIKTIDVNSDRFKELLVELYQNINMMQNVLNIKDSAYYDTNEFVNGQIFPPSPNASSSSVEAINRRQVFRKLIDFGALPNTATKTMAHNIDITAGYSFTRIYGTASDTTNLLYVPIPNANTDIRLSLSATNVIVTTSANYSTYDTTYIVVEYLKQ